MKKLLTLIFAFTFVLFLTACQTNSFVNDPWADEKEEVTEEVTEDEIIDDEEAEIIAGDEDESVEDPMEDPIEDSAEEPAEATGEPPEKDGPPEIIGDESEIPQKEVLPMGDGEKPVKIIIEPCAIDEPDCEQ